MRPYYDDGGVTIYLGCCEEVLPSLPSSFDLVFTSPPYNLGSTPWPMLGHWAPSDPTSGGKTKWRHGPDSAAGGAGYADHEDALPWEEYVAWQRAVLGACWDRLADDGAIFYQHKHRVVGGRLWTPLELIPDHLTLRQEIVWARAGGVNYTPVAYVPTSERIYVLARDAWRLRDKGASGVGDVWRIPQEANPRHPAPFPVQLPATAIQSAGATHVLDPFMGIGSTLVAARRLGVPAVGIEKSERYCEIAAERCGGAPLHPEDSLFGGTR